MRPDHDGVSRSKGRKGPAARQRNPESANPLQDPSAGASLRVGRSEEGFVLSESNHRSLARGEKEPRLVDEGAGAPTREVLARKRGSWNSLGKH